MLTKTKNMSLETRINEDIKKAMLAREKDRLEALRAVKASLLLIKTEKAGDEINNEKEISLLNKLVKQRKEAAEIYQQNNRKELADKELFEASVIETYLPKQMTAEELETEIKIIISEIGAKSQSEMGKVMGIASKRFLGKADNKLVSQIIKQLLSS